MEMLNKKNKSTRKIFVEDLDMRNGAWKVSEHLVHNQTMKGVEIYAGLLNEPGRDGTY